MKYRKFINEFKKHLVEQLLSGVKVSEICRQYDVAKQVLARWQRKYEQGELDNAPKNGQLATEIKIKELESLVGRLTLDNELLKKAVKLACSQQTISANSSSKTKIYSGALPGGVAC
ncbi:MAG: transposase [Candidatus Omnitrophica bacterium]|nr:transposase [Candidatus Omnitrophota bacterium]